QILVGSGWNRRHALYSPPNIRERKPLPPVASQPRARQPHFFPLRTLSRYISECIQHGMDHLQPISCANAIVLCILRQTTALTQFWQYWQHLGSDDRITVFNLVGGK
ncbi:unnamed protein product, partial [Ectocarpus sp. 4 AP-2014]